MGTRLSDFFLRKIEFHKYKFNDEINENDNGQKQEEFKTDNNDLIKFWKGKEGLIKMSPAIREYFESISREKAVELVKEDNDLNEEMKTMLLSLADGFSTKYREPIIDVHPTVMTREMLAKRVKKKKLQDEPGNQEFYLSFQIDGKRLILPTFIDKNEEETSLSFYGPNGRKDFDNAEDLVREMWRDSDRSNFQDGFPKIEISDFFLREVSIHMFEQDYEGINNTSLSNEDFETSPEELQEFHKERGQVMRASRYNRVQSFLEKARQSAETFIPTTAAATAVTA